MSTRPAAFEQQANTQIAANGGRVTRPRVAIYSLLLSSTQALSHTDIEERLDKSEHIDRVTVYRVLDWLTQHGLAHRILGEDRVWRFNTPTQSGHVGPASHPHFHCERCERVLCLNDQGLRKKLRLPRGFEGRSIDVTVHGLCADCHH